MLCEKPIKKWRIQENKPRILFVIVKKKYEFFYLIKAKSYKLK